MEYVEYSAMEYVLLGRGMFNTYREVENVGEACYLAFDLGSYPRLKELLADEDERDRAVAKKIKSQTDRVKADAAAKINEMQSQLNEMAAELEAVRKDRDDLRGKVSDFHTLEWQLRSQASEAQQARESDAHLLTSLLRQTRERANADRKVKGAKHHCGYVGVQASTISARTRDKTAMCWRTVLETPYQVILGEAVLDRIATDLVVSQEIRGDKLPGLLERMGVECASHFVDVVDGIAVFNSLEKNRDSMLNAALSSGENRCYELQVSADLRSGYWRVTIFTTKMPTLDAVLIPKNEG